jgi:hypothetical protein
MVKVTEGERIMKLTAEHEQALQGAGLDPKKVMGMNFQQILAIVQALLAALSPLVPSGGGGPNPPGSPKPP